MCSGSLSGCLTTSLSGVWKVSSLQRPSKLRHVHQGALEDFHNHLPAGPGVLVVHKLCQDLEKTHLRVVVRLVNALDDMLLQLELDSQLVRLVLGRQQLFRNICNVVWTQQLLTGPRRCAWSQIVLIKVACLLQDTSTKTTLCFREHALPSIAPNPAQRNWASQTSSSGGNRLALNAAYVGTLVPYTTLE